MATCAVCGYEAAGSFRFCPECGARANGRGREQRKVVTVLFCDVAGSTALGESLDAEALRATSRARRQSSRATAASSRSSSVRALRTAAEMQLALPELGIEGRIGVCSGEVVTGTDERLVTGDAVNVAAQLQQAAETR